MLSLSLLVLTGCNGGVGGSGGGKAVGLTGKVVFSNDGSPLSKGKVCLESSSLTASGELTSDGTFTLKAKNGLPPGTYRVYITNAVEVVGQNASGDNIGMPLIAQKYMSSRTSGLTVDIDESTTEFELKVDRFKK